MTIITIWLEDLQLSFNAFLDDVYERSLDYIISTLKYLDVADYWAVKIINQ